MRDVPPLVRQWRKKGGLTFKLVEMIVFVVFMAVIPLSYLFNDIMERSISEKAYEVGRVTVERVADASFNALAERTFENRVNLLEMLKETKETKMVGFLNISIYALNREGETHSFDYFTGFDEAKDALQDPALIARLLESQNKTVMRDVVNYRHGEDTFEAMRFVRPILFHLQGKEHVIGAAILHYDQEVIQGPIRQAIITTTLTTLAILFLSVALAWWLSNRLSRPILSIANAAKEVASGNLDVHVDIHTNDEIEALGDEFNKMARGLRERQKMQKFVSESAMNHIQDDSAKIELGGGSCLVQTFLFSDIRDFTAMSASKKPDEVVLIINHYLDLQTKIIQKYGGDIDKFIGDEIMATFKGDDDLLRAIMAAKELQKEIAKENTIQQEEMMVAVGVGINRGEVIVGNMGSRDRMDFTSIGAAVNLAARLCSKAQPGEILVSKALYHTLNQDLGGQDKGSILVKGFTDPVEIISIERP
ncbi:MAG: HAMP domain-containing protein [Campylobacterales bacterium]|nr:HAMP domain-containing protein [Campylobacterales bacterium]